MVSNPISYGAVPVVRSGAPPVFSVVRIARSLDFCVLFYEWLHFRLIIVLSVL